MSSSSRVFADGENAKIEIPVFISPTELIFSTSKRRALLSVYNPYGYDAQFKIMTTNPSRFDVSLTKGTIKPNRYIDVAIRLLNHRIEELPEPTDEPQVIDHFRISIQVGSLKGNRQAKVSWVSYADYHETDETTARLLGTPDEAPLSKVKLRNLKQSAAFLNLSSSQRSSIIQQQQSIQTSTSSRSSTVRSRSHLQDQAINQNSSGSNVNLVCFLGSIVCVVLLFLPLAIDSELCKKAKLYQLEQNGAHPVGIMSQLSSLLSVSYEMKFGCSFALGLFTYRLISTMPD